MASPGSALTLWDLAHKDVLDFNGPGKLHLPGSQPGSRPDSPYSAQSSGTATPSKDRSFTVGGSAADKGNVLSPKVGRSPTGRHGAILKNSSRSAGSGNSTSSRSPKGASAGRYLSPQRSRSVKISETIDEGENEQTRLPQIAEGRSRWGQGRSLATSGKGSVSLPALAQGRAQLNLTMLSQKELKQLDDIEAFRHIVIQRAGSLKQAYKMMDVNKDGQVNLEQFESGLAKLGIRGSPIVGRRSIRELFNHFSKRHPEISLQDLLGYVPVNAAARRGVQDTRTMWLNYHNKTSALRTQLARVPKWNLAHHAENWYGENAVPEDNPAFDQSRHAHSHKELRAQLRDARQRSDNAVDKRDLVKGLVAPEAAPDHWAEQMRNVERHGQRIRGAMKDCAKARHELINMQKEMQSIHKPVSLMQVMEGGANTRASRVLSQEHKQNILNIGAMMVNAIQGQRGGLFD